MKFDKVKQRLYRRYTYSDMVHVADICQTIVALIYMHVTRQAQKMAQLRHMLAGTLGTMSI